MAMFDHLIQVNDLQSSFKQYDITDTDLAFVKEQIAGPIDTEQCSSQMQSVSKQNTVVCMDCYPQGKLSVENFDELYQFYMQTAIGRKF